MTRDLVFMLGLLCAASGALVAAAAGLTGRDPFWALVIFSMGIAVCIVSVFMEEDKQDG